MADNDLIIGISGDTKEFEKSLKSLDATAKRAVDETSASIKKMDGLLASAQQKISKYGTLITAAFAAAGAASLGLGFQFNKEVEMLETGFKVMLGSTEKAKKLMSELRAEAETTPFGVQDLANASKTLLAFGSSAQDVVQQMRMLGDVALGNKERFASLSLVFGQIQSAGKLMGQDLLQLINVGFNPLQIMSEKSGKSMSQLKDDMAKGLITFEMVKQAFVDATSEGGKFYNSMDEASKATQGLESTLQDVFVATMGEVMKPLNDFYKNELLPTLIKIFEALGSVASGSASFFEALEGLIGGQIPAGLKVLISLLSGVAAGFAAFYAVQLISGLAAVASGINLVSVAMAALNAVMALNPFVLIISILAAVGTALYLFLKDNEEVLDTIAEYWHDFVNFLKEAANKIIRIYNAIYSALDMDSAITPEFEIMTYEEKKIKEKKEEEIAIAYKADLSGYTVDMLAAEDSTKKLASATKDTSKEQKKLAENARKAAEYMKDLDIEIAQLAGDTERYNQLQIEKKLSDMRQRFTELLPSVAAVDAAMLKYGETIKSAMGKEQARELLENQVSALSKFKDILSSSGDTAKQLERELLRLQLVDLKKLFKDMPEVIASIDKAMADLDKELDKTFTGGLEKSIDDFVDKWTDAAQTAGDIFTAVMDTVSQAAGQVFDAVFDGAKMKIGDLFKQLGKMLFQMGIMKLFGSSFSGLGFGTAHAGGLIGDDNFPITSGPLRSDERIMKVQTGERILSRSETRDYDRGQPAGNLIVQNIDQVGVRTRQERQTMPNGDVLLKNFILDTVNNNIAGQGSAASAIGSAFGLQPIAYHPR